FRRDSDLNRPAVGPAIGVFHFLRAALLDWNVLHTITYFPIERRRGKCDVERDAIILRREGFQVSTDLIGDIPGVSRAIGPHKHKVDRAALHEMSSSVIGYDGVRHAMLAQFPGS